MFLGMAEKKEPRRKPEERRAGRGMGTPVSLGRKDGSEGTITPANFYAPFEDFTESTFCYLLWIPVPRSF